MITLPPQLTPSELLDRHDLSPLIDELLRDCRWLRMEGRLSEAERRALDAVDASREASDQTDHGVALVHLGDVHREMGRLGPALANYQKAHRIFQRQTSRYQRHNEAVAAYALGLVHQLLGNDIDALRWYQQSGNLFERVKDDWVAVNALHQVETCTRVQRWTKALSDCLADERTRTDANPFTDIWVPIILSEADETAFAIAKFKVDKYATLSRLEIKGASFRMQPVKGRQRALSPGSQYYARRIPDEACGSLEAEKGDYALVEREREVDKEGPAVLETLGGPQFGRFKRDAEGHIVFERPGATPILIGGKDIDEDLGVGYVTALLKPATPTQPSPRASSKPTAPPSPSSPSPEPSAAPPPDSADVESPYDKLLRMVGGDEEAAERLIAYERERAPGASRSELIDRAIARLIQDRQ